MVTLVSDELRWTARQIISECGYVSAVLSGLAPDARHRRNGGYHCSVLDLRAHGNSGDYSNSRPDDRNMQVEYCAAFDISMNPKDMIRAYGRVHAVWTDRSDPRRRFVNAINVWDGSGDATRLDFVSNTAKYADPSHKWHNHGEIRRRYVRDARAARAIVSIFMGEPKASWIAREEPRPEEDDVLNADDKKWLSAEIAKQVQEQLRALVPTAEQNGQAALKAVRQSPTTGISDTGVNLIGAQITEAIVAGTPIKRFPANQGK